MKKLGIFEKNKCNKPKVCLSLNVNDVEEAVSEIEKYGALCDLFEWRVDKFADAETLTKEMFQEALKAITRLTGRKKLIVTYSGSDELTGNRIRRWAIGISDYVDIGMDNSEVQRLIREAHKRKTKVVVSYHDFEDTPDKNIIAETYLRMEKLGGDILKIACMANCEEDVYSILEGAALYKQLKKSRQIIAISMGETGQVSRICAGDFGSVITFCAGSEKTAPGQFSIEEIGRLLDTYYDMGK